VTEESPALGLDMPMQPRDAGYRVLARKYRPQTFEQLIGQEAMVRTLGNAIKRDRIAHAFLLTGVRGVGKTSTARLIAKALNCIGPAGNGGPTIDPCNVCEPCVAIAEGRHIDVIEMDAASNTSVDNIREIIEAVRYSAVSARYKVYIVDEVHMLSKNAFNALLKTLEEPPPHVKFIFATTEIDKVPVTVLSRCQRFDLRRIPADLLASHFAHVLEQEHVVSEPDALAMIARAAEGSVRDGLSILDQAVAHADMDSGGKVSAEQVQGMLGLSDRGALRRLLGFVLDGDGKSALAILAEQHALGVDPAGVVRGLLELVHGITVTKVGTTDDPALPAEERAALAEWAGKLGHGTLHRLWQMLLRGHDEVVKAADPREAADMAVLRAVYASSLPDPGELAKRIGEGGVAAPASPTPSAPAAPADFGALVAKLEAAGRHTLAQQLHDNAGLVRYAPPELALRAVKPLAADFARELTAALKALDGTQWQVSLSDAPAQATLLEQETAARLANEEFVKAQPVVAGLLDAFPSAELTGWTLNRSNAA
jgi:DNA polymerase-3 subunit gamma/tau